MQARYCRSSFWLFAYLILAILAILATIIYDGSGPSGFVAYESLRTFFDNLACYKRLCGNASECLSTLPIPLLTAQ